MNTSAYWHQKAAPWVSASVLVGGLVSAMLLVFIYKVDSAADSLSPVVSDSVYARYAE